MPAPPDTSRLCIHTITTKPWSIEEAAPRYAAAGVRGISVWQDAVQGRDLQAAGRMLRDEGLEIVSYVRGGFFPSETEAGRDRAIADNRRIIEEAAALGAPLVVLVCGAAPGQSLDTSRRQIRDGIAAVLPDAEAAGIRLGIEPLHPMYADTRSAVNTLAQANDMADELASDRVGVVVDVYHLWWDPALETEIARCGQSGHLYAFHVCDWRVPTSDMLNDRGLMGEGCIPVRRIRGWVEAAGFDGFNEVEIFSTRYWSMDQQLFLDHIVEAYRRHT